MPVTILDAMTHTASGLATITVSAGANRALFVGLPGYHFSNAVPPTSAAVGGQSMEAVGAADNTAVALSIFALREAGIAAMANGTLTIGGQTYSASDCVWWSVQGADQSAPFVKTEQVTSSAVAASLVRVANSMTFAIGVLNASDTLTWANPTDDAEAFIGSAFGLTYGGEADTARTANWTSDNPGVQFAGIAFNVAPASGNAALAGNAAASASATGAVTEPALRTNPLRDIDSNVLKVGVTYAIVHAFLSSNRSVIAASWTNKTTGSNGKLLLPHASLQGVGTSYDIIGFTADGSDRFHDTALVVDTSV